MSPRTCRLSELARMIQSGAVPLWLYNHVTGNQDHIIAVLMEKGVYSIEGPGGVIITVQAGAKEPG